MKFRCNNKTNKPVGNINSIHDFIVRDLDNKEVNLKKFKDMNPIIVVNVASL